MSFTVEYAGFCIQGLVRNKNEDNICCGDKYLPIVHTDDIKGLSGVFSTKEQKHFAVFDGMGGEKSGEVASYLAARTFSSYSGPAGGVFADEAKKITEEMNCKVLDYAAGNRIISMGSTVAALFFKDNDIRGFNIGDSRCYLYENGGLRQLSVDHVIKGSSGYSGYLYQCLGISEKESVLEPSLYSAQYKEGDIILLCTDGLTGLVGEKRIGRVLRKKISLEEKLQELKDIVVLKGAVDNTTILLFETKKRKKWFSMMRAGCLSWFAGN